MLYPLPNYHDLFATAVNYEMHFTLTKLKSISQTGSKIKMRMRMAMEIGMSATVY